MGRRLTEPSGDATYVLCEINVSSIFAIPREALTAIANLAASRLGKSLLVVVSGARYWQVDT